jgi:predicted NAD/FAD-dependent oxidoreductase
MVELSWIARSGTTHTPIETKRTPTLSFSAVRMDEKTLHFISFRIVHSSLLWHVVEFSKLFDWNYAVVVVLATVAFAFAAADGVVCCCGRIGYSDDDIIFE